MSRITYVFKHNLKQILLSLLAVFVAIALTNCTPKTNTPLRIGSNLWTGYETLYLARDLGYYNDKPIRLVDYPSGTEEVRAYRNKEIEGAGLSIDQALVLAATQENIRIIAIMDVSNGGDVILVSVMNYSRSKFWSFEIFTQSHSIFALWSSANK